MSINLEFVWYSPSPEFTRIFLALLIFLVVCLVWFVLVLCLVCPVLPASLDCSFQIARFLFSNVKVEVHVKRQSVNLSIKH